MQKLKNYIHGEWVEGKGDGIRLLSAIDSSLVAVSDTEGLDFEQALDYGRTVGYKNLSSMTFYDRGQMLKKIAQYLLARKKDYYELSYNTGATYLDCWVDVDGGIGTFFSYSGLAKRMLPNTTFWVEGEVIKTSKNGTHLGTHILTPSEGVSVHINAYNFPVWGMMEKLSTCLLAGVPAIVKPAPAGCYVTHAVFKDMIESGLLPKGAVQLVCGDPGNILDFVKDGDSVAFTGSGKTGRKLRQLPSIAGNAVRFNMESDSLNAAILGLDEKPGRPDSTLFIREVKNEMTCKSGQRCTAIRRIMVPEHLIQNVEADLAKALDKTTMGNPHNRETRMGALVGKEQYDHVEKQLDKLKSETELVYNGHQQLLDASYDKGAFMTPKLFYNDKPFEKEVSHNVEAFGPVSTLMPYQEIEEAAELARKGKGSLVGSIMSHDNDFIAKTTLKMASTHGRVYVLNRDNAAEATGHGSPLPTLMHGGPGEAGGGEEMGGLDGLHFFLQKTAIQGSPDVLTAITQVYTEGAEKRFSDKHPFKKYFEEIEVGDSLETQGRTITETDIVNFADLSWDHFYVHTDVTSLNETIFEHRVAHGYLLLSFAAGLFVDGKKGPVIANYGLETCNFLQPVYAGDTITVYLTAKEKVNRGVKGKNVPSGVVKWFVEVVNQREETVCVATILTLVAKKSPFLELRVKNIEKILNGLTEDTQPLWGKMKPQQMVEHLEQGLLVDMGVVKNVKCFTPEDQIETFQNFLYTFHPIPKEYKAPFLPADGSLPPLKHKNLQEAKTALVETLRRYLIYYREHPDAQHINYVYGLINKEMSELLARKHFTHHFEQFGLFS